MCFPPLGGGEGQTQSLPTEPHLYPKLIHKTTSAGPQVFLTLDHGLLTTAVWLSSTTTYSTVFWFKIFSVHIPHPLWWMHEGVSLFNTRSLDKSQRLKMTDSKYVFLKQFAELTSQQGDNQLGLTLAPSKCLFLIEPGSFVLFYSRGISFILSAFNFEASWI